MTGKPRLLDLFCGAGGAAMGYHRAGFDVVGVDINPQPHYPFESHQRDALDVLDNGWKSDGVWPGVHSFHAIHASPPCQDHSSLKSKHDGHGTGWMLDETIGRLKATGLPWVVENVVGPTVTMDGWWFVLCGSMFDETLMLRRHRRFGSSDLMLAPLCRHDLQIPQFRTLDSRRPGALASVVGVHGHISYAGEADLRNAAMGIDWMTQPELAQAIPPAYTHWIGEQLRYHIDHAKGPLHNDLQGERL